jgi:MFS family permease
MAGGEVRPPGHRAAAVVERSTSLWRNRGFAAFWFGESVSLFGSQVTFVALPLLAMLTLDVSAAQLGTLRFAEYLPFLGFTLFFGVLADRVRRRTLMIASNAVRAVLVAIVPLCTMLGLMRLPLLVVIAFLVGTCSAMFEVCWLSYVPGLVDRDRLVEAMGKVSASHSAAEVAGPGLGGVLVQLLSAPIALLVDAVSYLAATVSLALVRQPEPRAEAHEPRRPVARELADGLRFAFREPHIRATAYSAALGNFFALITETVFLVYAVRELRLTPAFVGLTLSALGMGGVLGAAFAGRLARSFPVGRLYVIARTVGAAGTLLLPLASGPTPVVVGLCMLSFFVWQAALANTNVINASLRQVLTPEHLRGRVNASVRTLVFGALPLGGLVGGLLGGLVGLKAALWLGAIGYAFSIVPILLSPIPRLRTLPSDESAMAPT